MKIILANDVESLGKKGDVVVVKDGYARNYLVPKGLAFMATKGAVRQAEVMRRAREEAERKARDEAQERVAGFEASPVYISARSGEEGRLFGSVTSSDVARAVEEQLGHSVDRRDIRLEEPIRSLGSHPVTVHLYESVYATVTVEVIAHEEEPA
jgi:large subunit ribosomal protein L9